MTLHLTSCERIPNYKDKQMAISEATKQRVGDLTRRLTNEGRVIEAGWHALRVLVVPDDASQEQLSMMRLAFFSGAQHLYSAMVQALRSDQDDKEPTAEDMARLDKIEEELSAFVERVLKPILETIGVEEIAERTTKNPGAETPG
jgi:hypothetical protein